MNSGTVSSLWNETGSTNFTSTTTISAPTSNDDENTMAAADDNNDWSLATGLNVLNFMALVSLFSQLIISGQ